MKKEEIILKQIKSETFKDTSNLTVDTEIFTEGILDSMGLALMIDFLEEEFNIEIDDSEIIHENFNTILTIVSFVNNKTK
jgi:acyl carrier protein